MVTIKYVVGDKTYIQKPLVLGQIRQLAILLKGMTIPREADIAGLLDAVGDKLPEALAIVLTPEDTSVRDKDISALASDIEFGIELEVAIKVIEDFFICNPVASILESLGAVMERVAEKIIATGSKNSPSSSPEGTLPNATQSSGVTP